MDARVNSGDIVGSTRLDQNSPPVVREFRHQRQDVPLQERFSPGDLNQWAVKIEYPGHDLR
jgi:hypothetical protein